MSRVARACGWLLVADLLSLGAVAVDGARHLGQAERHEEMLRRVEDVGVAASAVNEQVLGARAGTVAHFDGVVSAGCAVEARVRHAAALSADPCLAPDEKASMARELDALDTVLEVRRNLVERFKSELSVLRNSQRYLPVAARDLAHHPGEASPSARRATAVLDVVHGVLAYAAAGDGTRPAELERALAGLDEEAAGAGESERGDLALVQRHARVVIERRQVVDGIVAGLLRVPVREHLDRLRAQVLRHRVRADADMTARFRWVMALGALALLLGLVLMGTRRGSEEDVGGAGAATREVQALVVAVAVRGIPDALDALPAPQVSAALAAHAETVRRLAQQGGWPVTEWHAGVHVVAVPRERARELRAWVDALLATTTASWEPGEPVDVAVALDAGAVSTDAAGRPGGPVVLSAVTSALGLAPPARVASSSLADSWTAADPAAVDVHAGAAPVGMP